MYYLIDRYSYLNFAIGIICFFSGISLKTLFIIRVLYFLIKNNKARIKYLNKYILWPKQQNNDHLAKQIVDILLSLFGWLSANYKDIIIKRYRQKYIDR